MRNYEARKPSYFATPSPQLVRSLNTSLKQILSRPLEERFQKHIETSKKVKAAISALGLRQLAQDPSCAANGMTAVYLPDGITLPEVLPKVLQKGVVFAGGLHREIAPKYFRIGHMGISALNDDLGHIEKALSSLREALGEAGYKLP